MRVNGHSLPVARCRKKIRFIFGIILAAGQTKDNGSAGGAPMARKKKIETETTAAVSETPAPETPAPTSTGEGETSEEG